MALKHYGGSTPTQATSWVCPSCNTENTVPLKAGCQACGAGNDAKKVEQVTVHKPVAVGPTEIPIPASVLALEQWLAKRTSASTEVDWEIVREAFMAGVAWAQAQHQPQGETLGGGKTGALSGLGEAIYQQHAASAAPITLWTDDTKHQDPVDTPTLQTILSALAFYSNNVLAYGGVEGQLSTEAVNALITRLTPQEPS